MKSEKMTSEILKKMKVKPIRFIIKNQKLICTMALLIFSFIPLFAQAGAGAGDVLTKIKGWGDSIKLILNAIVGVFSIVGGFLIFIQYMQGNEQAQKNFIRFVIGLAIFGLVAIIANVFLPK